MNVAVLGNWHLAHVTAAGLSELGHSVYLVPQAALTVSKETKSLFKKPQLFEPGLDALWEKHRGESLHVGGLGEAHQAQCEVFFLAIDTPVDDHDKIQLDTVMAYINALKELPESAGKVLVVQSQVPAGTSDQFRLSLEGKFEVVNMPENLRLGKAISLFLEPEFMYLGGSPEGIRKVRDVFSHWTCAVKELSLKEAEMVKHATNFYLATCVSYSSFISDLCESLGIVATNVIDVLKLDTRVNPKAPLNPGFGFAGGTLGRDVQVLRDFAGKSHEFKAFADAIYEINEYRVERLAGLIQMSVPKGSKIALLGLTYKVGTDTLRRSHALAIAQNLHRSGYVLSAFDPKVNPTENSQALSDVGISAKKTVNEAIEGTSAAILCTPWPEIVSRGWTSYAREGKRFFDLTNQCLSSFKDDAAAMKNYYCPGLDPSRMI